MDNEDFFFDMKDYKLRVVKFNEKKRKKREKRKERKKRTVFIFNLRLETTKTQLEKAFQVYGNIISSSVKFQSNENKQKFGAV